MALWLFDRPMLPRGLPFRDCYLSSERFAGTFVCALEVGVIGAPILELECMEAPGSLRFSRVGKSGDVIRPFLEMSSCGFVLNRWKATTPWFYIF